MTWQEKINAWRKLRPAQRKAIRLAQAPRQVALSMAFEGEPVDWQWLEELHRRKSVTPLQWQAQSTTVQP